MPLSNFIPQLCTVNKQWRDLPEKEPYLTLSSKNFSLLPSHLLETATHVEYLGLGFCSFCSADSSVTAWTCRSVSGRSRQSQAAGKLHHGPQNVTNLCPCEGTTSSIPGAMRIPALCTNFISSGMGC